MYTNSKPEVYVLEIIDGIDEWGNLQSEITLVEDFDKYHVKCYSLYLEDLLDLDAIINQLDIFKCINHRLAKHAYYEAVSKIDNILEWHGMEGLELEYFDEWEMKFKKDVGIT